MKNEAIFKENYNIYLRQQMVLSGATLRDVAEMTGYSYEGIRQILKGNGSSKGVYSICRALNISMRKILSNKILGE